MDIKSSIVDILEKNKGKYISGTEIAAKVNVSRNAVWKYINALKAEGYIISSCTNLGYKLEKSGDSISASGIEALLNSKRFNVEIVKTVTSTNSVMKCLAESGEKEGHVLVALRQTEGRGRMGRSFFSPDGSGIYMSILLRPQLPATESVMITTAAAVAAANAIEKACKKQARIKWVNDIFCNNKKVCGILTEAAISFESGYLSYAVLGIGINVFAPDNGFPDDIRDKATQLFESKTGNGKIRNMLIADFLNAFEKYYTHLDEKPHLEEYRNRLMLLGEKVTVLCGNSSYNATAVDIDDDFRLAVRLDDGTVKYLDSGEISVRGF